MLGQTCRVTRSEADWLFDFADNARIAVHIPWRVVTSDGIAHGSEDDGQLFGLLQPVDGEARTNQLIAAQKVASVEVDERTADLSIVFDGGVRLDLFNNSAGYEGWQATIRGTGDVTIVAYGGGKLAVH